MDNTKQTIQPVDEQAPAATEALADLPVATEQTEEIKGGSLPGIHKVSDVTLKRGVVG